LSDDPFEFTDDPVETGIVTVAVTSELTPEAVQAAKALVNLPDVSPVTLAQLAREIAQDIGLLPAILQKHKLTQAQYEFLEKHNAFFRGILTNEIRNWQSIKSTEVRLRLQAQAALEQQMPTIANRMGNAAEKLGDAVEAAKLFARIAGVDSAPVGPATTGERYQIVIDLGADRIVVGHESAAPQDTGAPTHGTLQKDGQGQGKLAALRRDAQGAGNLPTLQALPER
jgi:hypothetical protein